MLPILSISSRCAALAHLKARLADHRLDNLSVIYQRVKVDQTLDRFRSAPLGAGFEKSAEQNKGRDDADRWRPSFAL